MLCCTHEVRVCMLWGSWHNLTFAGMCAQADVSTYELTKLEAKLLKEASKECFAQNWEEALLLFTNALAVSEKTKSCADPGTRGTFVHNIGFCLHCMGEFEAAKAYYEQSIECLQKVQFPLHTKVLNGILYPERLFFEAIYGGLNHNRIQMTKERLLDISFNRYACTAAPRNEALCT